MDTYPPAAILPLFFKNFLTSFLTHKAGKPVLQGLPGLDRHDSFGNLPVHM